MNGYIEQPSYRGSTEIKIYRTAVLQPQAELAVQLMEKFGMIAGTADGEDSTGRVKARLLTEQEVVDRACNCAQLAYDAFYAKGWILTIPAPKPAREDK